MYLIQKLKEFRSKNLSTKLFSKEEINYVFSRTISYLISKIDTNSSDVHYLNMTGISDIDTYLSVLIQYGVIDDNYVIDKDEAITTVELLENIARAKNIQYSGYLIPAETYEFSDLKKDSSYAQLVYKMASLGYITQNQEGDIHPFAIATETQILQAISKAFPYDSFS